MKKIILIILLIFITGCDVSNTSENRLIIDKIDINHIVETKSIKDEVDEITMFTEYGRPNIKNTNTVIGAHSGTGSKALFNGLNYLNIGDEISYIYNDFSYDYVIVNKYSVNKKDVDVLNNKEFTSLTLITCDIYNKDNRIIVVSKLLTNID